MLFFFFFVFHIHIQFKYFILIFYHLIIIIKYNLLFCFTENNSVSILNGVLSSIYGWKTLYFHIQRVVIIVAVGSLFIWHLRRWNQNIASNFGSFIVGWQTRICSDRYSDVLYLDILSRIQIIFGGTKYVLNFEKIK